jgi:two-component system nitrate/nitrite sensor histidine kinase NarX
MIEQTSVAPNNTAPNRMRNAIAAALALLILVIAAILASSLYEQRVNEQTRELVTHDLTNKTDTLKAVMQARFAALEGVDAFADAHETPTDLQTEWDKFASTMLARAQGIRAIALVKNDQTLVYTEEERREALLKIVAAEISRLNSITATQNNQILLSDPFVIHSGELGVAASKSRANGRTRAVIVADVDTILKDSNFAPDGLLYRFSSIRNQNGSIIYGDKAGFDNAPIVIDVPLADGKWEIGGQTSSNLQASNVAQLWFVRLISFAVAALSAAVVLLALSRQSRLEGLVDARTRDLAMVNEELAHDNAERRRVEQSLRESEARNSALLVSIPDLIFRLDNEERFIGYYVRDEKQLFVPPAAFLNKKISEVMPEDIAKRFHEAAQLAAKTDEAQGIEYQLPDVDNPEQMRFYESRIVAIGPNETLSIVRDVTESKQAYNLLEQRVAERTRELSTLLSVSRQLVSTLDLQPLLNIVLDQMEQLIGFDVAMILAPQGADFVYLGYRGPGTSEDVVGSFAPAEIAYAAQQVVGEHDTVLIHDLLSDELFSREFMRKLSPEVREQYAGIRSALGVPMEIKDRVIGVLILAHKRPHYYTDIQAQLASGIANQAAVSMENARLYEQAQGIAVLEERQRLARDLHDAVTQTLFSSSLIAEVLPMLWERNRTEAERRLEELRWFTRGALAEMRMLLLELRPTGLTDTLLGELLRQLAEAAMARTRFPITLQLQGQAFLPPDVQITFYRIAQEALNNVWKHSDATQVRIGLLLTPAEAPLPDMIETTVNGTGSFSATEANGHRSHAAYARLEIEDNGRGFDPDKIPANHFGLTIMQERAETIQAQLKVESEIGKGSKVTLEWRERLTLPTSSMTSQSIEGAAI